MGRNNTLPDGAASLIAGLDKTWRWRKSENCILEKVKAHPEEFKKPEEWDHLDKDIWAADQIAGGTLEASMTIKASTLLRLVSYNSKAMEVDQKGLPFVKNISKR